MLAKSAIFSVNVYSIMVQEPVIFHLNDSECLSHYILFS